jgi:hypothetical protein
MSDIYITTSALMPPVASLSSLTLALTATALHMSTIYMNRFTPLGVLGSATAIGGVLLYSIVKGHYDEIAKAERRNSTLKAA